MALSPKSYVLTAASGSHTDIFNALIAHFTSAPGYWQLKPGVTNSVAGQALVITQKVSPTHDINWRATSTTAIAQVVDRGMGVTNCGTSSVAPTGATAQAHAERTFTDATALAKGIYISEHQEAIYILFNNAAYTLMPRMLAGGFGIGIPDDVYAAFGIDGSFSVNGIPGNSVTANHIAPVGGTTNSQASSVLTKCGNTSAMWWGINCMYGSGLNFGNLTVANPGVTNEIVLHPVLLAGYDSSLGVRILGPYKHIFMYPIRTGISQNQLPRTTSESATQEWIFIFNAATASNLVMSWEKNVTITKPV